MSSDPAPSLAGRLATACYRGDLPSGKAAVADGASVHEKGKSPGWFATVLPLTAAVATQCRDVVVWLLSSGADPNGDDVMATGAYRSSAGILQLLIDAGGDVNRESSRQPPLFSALDNDNSEEYVRVIVRVLLAQPSLDLTVTHHGIAPEQRAHGWGRSALADEITQEVSRDGVVFVAGMD